MVFRLCSWCKIWFKHGNANVNPTFTIDKKAGVINFSSLGGSASVVLEYTDGMEGGDDSKISVNKLFEEYIYAYIKYSILNSRLGVQEYIVRRAQRQIFFTT